MMTIKEALDELQDEAVAKSAQGVMTRGELCHYLDSSFVIEDYLDGFTWAEIRNMYSYDIIVTANNILAEIRFRMALVNA